jgi:class 3 adenylate cyclase
MPAKNLAIMFTDIKGFTARTSDSTRVGVITLLAEHERLLLPVFRYFDGTVIKTIGDAFLVRFDSTTDAVLAGLAVQEVLRQHNAFVQDAKDRLEVRVAINAGDVELKDGDVLGEPVNVAARLEAITEAGEVWFTETVYLSMNRKEVPSSEVGERVFKGIPQAVRVYKVIHDPNSEQAKSMAEGVRLTKDGPVLKGLREPRRFPRQKIAWMGAGALAAVAAILLVVLNPFRPDEAARAAAQARDRMAKGENLAALEILDVQLKKAPGHPELGALVVQAGEAHVDFLLKERTKKEALEWLRAAIGKQPILEPLRRRIPALDTDVTVHELYEKKRHSDELWTGIRKLIDSYPQDPDVPYLAKRIVEKWMIPEAGLFYYEEAIKRGGDKYKNDPHIFETLVHIFGDDEPGEAKYAHELARKYFDPQRAAWARKALDEGGAMAVLNAWAILEEKKDAALEDPYYRALKAVIGKKDLDAACRTLAAVEDAKRGAHARQIVKEVVDKGGLKADQEQALLPAMDAVKKEE